MYEAVCARKQNQMGELGCQRLVGAAVFVVVKDGSRASNAAEISVSVDGECVTLICSRAWRMFINVGWGGDG